MFIFYRRNRRFYKKLGIPVTAVEDVTSSLHLGRKSKDITPKSFGGILNRQDNESVQQMKEFDIPQIDLVIVDLYPFEKTVASGADESDIIEKLILADFFNSRCRKKLQGYCYNCFSGRI
jgi:AICAR transformylase/IMP cyclohydrolase PurH